MPCPNYIKGRRKEYKVVHREKDKGCLSFRSAGSHSPVDVVSVDTTNHIIKLIQCKPDDMSTYQINKLLSANKLLNGVYIVAFSVE